MGAKKTATKKKGAVAKVKSAIGGKLGLSKTRATGRRRHKGPTYWANKVLVERLKKKYNRLKYGGR